MLNETRYHQGFAGIIIFFPFIFFYFPLLSGYIYSLKFASLALFPVVQIIRCILICSAFSFPGGHRYKKLLCTVDLTKDFFFSYSYHVMRSLQNNLSDNKAGEFLYETMFVWNEFLTRGIRNNLKNTLWTVALVYGFFKQVCNMDFDLLYGFSVCLYIYALSHNQEGCLFFYVLCLRACLMYAFQKFWTVSSRLALSLSFMLQSTCHNHPPSAVTRVRMGYVKLEEFLLVLF